ncbi:unnamed protein product, partial [Allacma fusca]
PAEANAVYNSLVSKDIGENRINYYRHPYILGHADKKTIISLDWSHLTFCIKSEDCHLHRNFITKPRNLHTTIQPVVEVNENIGQMMDSSEESDYEVLKPPNTSSTKQKGKVKESVSYRTAVTSSRYSCDECVYKTDRKYNLKAHKLTHRKNPKLVIKERKKYSCSVCNNYSTFKLSSWKKHVRTGQHQQLNGITEAFDGKFHCPEPHCCFFGKRWEILRTHLQEEHEKELEKQELTFETNEAFQDWRNKLQVTESVKFVKYTGAKGVTQ